MSSYFDIIKKSAESAMATVSTDGIGGALSAAQAAVGPNPSDAPKDGEVEPVDPSPPMSSAKDPPSAQSPKGKNPSSIGVTATHKGRPSAKKSINIQTATKEECRQFISMQSEALKTKQTKYIELLKRAKALKEDRDKLRQRVAMMEGDGAPPSNSDTRDEADELRERMAAIQETLIAKAKAFAEVDYQRKLLAEENTSLREKIRAMDEDATKKTPTTADDGDGAGTYEARLSLQREGRLAAEARLDGALKQRDAAHSALSAANAEQTKLRDEMVSLQAQLTTTKEALKESESKVLDVQSKLDEMMDGDDDVSSTPSRAMELELSAANDSVRAAQDELEDIRKAAKKDSERLQALLEDAQRDREEQSKMLESVQENAAAQTTEIQRLKDVIDSKEAELMEYSTRLEESNKSMEDAELARDAAMDEAKALATRLEESNKSMEDAAQAHRNAAGTLLESSKEMDMLRGELAEAQEAQSRAQDKCKHLEESHASDMERVIASHAQELDRVASAHQKEVQEIKCALENAETQAEQAKAMADARAQRLVSAIEEVKASSESASHELNTEMHHLRTQLDTCKAELVRSETQADEAIAKVKEEMESKEKHLQQSMERATALEHQLEGVKEEMESKEKHLQQSMERTTALEHQLEGVKEEMNSCKSLLDASRKSLESGSASALEEKEDLLNQLSSSRAHSNKINEELARVKEEVLLSKDKYTSACTDVERLTHQVNQLECKMEESRVREEDMRAKVSEANQSLVEAQASAMEEKAKWMEDHEKAMEQKQDKVDKLQAMLSDASSTQEQLNEEMDDARKELASTQDTLMEAQEDVKEWKNRVEEAEEALGGARKELASTQDTLMEAQEDVKEWKNRAEEAEEALKEVEQHTSNKEEEMSRVKELMEEVAMRTKEVDDVKKQWMDVNARLQQCEDDKVDLNARLQQCEDDKVDLNARLDEAHRELLETRELHVEEAKASDEKLLAIQSRVSELENVNVELMECEKKTREQLDAAHTRLGTFETIRDTLAGKLEAALQEASDLRARVDEGSAARSKDALERVQGKLRQWVAKEQEARNALGEAEKRHEEAIAELQGRMERVAVAMETRETQLRGELASANKELANARKEASGASDAQQRELEGLQARQAKVQRLLVLADKKIKEQRSELEKRTAEREDAVAMANKAREQLDKAREAFAGAEERIRESMRVEVTSSVQADVRIARETHRLQLEELKAAAQQSERERASLEEEFIAYKRRAKAMLGMSMDDRDGREPSHTTTTTTTTGTSDVGELGGGTSDGDPSSPVIPRALSVQQDIPHGTSLSATGIRDGQGKHEADLRSEIAVLQSRIQEYEEERERMVEAPPLRETEEWRQAERKLREMVQKEREAAELYQEELQEAQQRLAEVGEEGMVARKALEADMARLRNKFSTQLAQRDTTHKEQLESLQAHLDTTKQESARQGREKDTQMQELSTRNQLLEERVKVMREMLSAKGGGGKSSVLNKRIRRRGSSDASASSTTSTAGSMIHRGASSSGGAIRGVGVVDPSPSRVDSIDMSTTSTTHERHRSSPEGDTDGESQGSPRTGPLLHTAIAHSRHTGELARLRAKHAQLQDSSRDLENRVSLYEEQMRVLKEQMRAYQRQEKREDLNVEYLKNVIVKYMETDEHDAMMPVLCNLLQFSPEEVKSINSKRKERKEAIEKEKGSSGGWGWWGS